MAGYSDPDDALRQECEALRAEVVRLKKARREPLLVSCKRIADEALTMAHDAHEKADKADEERDAALARAEAAEREQQFLRPALQAAQDANEILRKRRETLEEGLRGMLVEFRYEFANNSAVTRARALLAPASPETKEDGA